MNENVFKNVSNATEIFLLSIIFFAALVRLASSAPQVPVCVPRSGQGFLGVRCVASGWSGRPAAALQRRRLAGPPGPRAHAHLAVVASSSCRSLYAAKYNITLNAGHLCAAGRGGLTAGTCLVRTNTKFFTLWKNCKKIIYNSKRNLNFFEIT